MAVNKTFLVIQREYLSRVKKKTFLLMTFLVPMLILGMYALIAFLTIKGADDPVNIRVIDESGFMAEGFTNKKGLTFSTETRSLAEGKKEVQANDEMFLLFIPAGIANGGKAELYSQKKPGISTMGRIEDQMNDQLRNKMLKDAGIDPETLGKIKPDVSITAKEITPEGEKDSSAGAAMAVGFAAAILIYISLFIYGAQVMRGVIEEKTNRIVEVIVSSIKPFQLMLGKIIGIGLVGLTQFLLWILLSFGLMTVAGSLLLKGGSEKELIEQVAAKENVDVKQVTENTGLARNLIDAAKTVDYTRILTLFIIYFLGGYMLYSALFAAVGSAVDNETETQQFMFPITMPLLFTYILSFSFIINNPNSNLSFWLSMIPFTSPIAMMVRLPFGVPDWQIYVSVVLLIAGFLFTTWVAARIYRVGILMYGKKTSYKELAKWFMYKE